MKEYLHTLFEVALFAVTSVATAVAGLFISHRKQLSEEINSLRTDVAVIKHEQSTVKEWLGRVEDKLDRVIEGR
jgi:hypothetical protein